MKESQQDNKNVKRSDSILVEQIKQCQSCVTNQTNSSYWKQYQTYFQSSSITKQKIKQYSAQLVKNRIFYSQSRFTCETTVIKLYESTCCQVMVLSISFSFFNFQITVFNFQQQLLGNKLPLISWGNFGRIHLSRSLQNELFALKSIEYNKNIKNCSIPVPRRILEQYCLNKLFSALKIGPYIPTHYLGFDLLINDSTVEFAIQLCQKNIDFSVSNIQQMKQSLQLMHSFKIIHGDIKPDNIMWSAQYNKPVFIDFGFSKCIKEQIGKMTMTSYFGTFDYASPQMTNNYPRNFGLVDLYYNDVHGMQKVQNNKQGHFQIKAQFFSNNYYQHSQDIFNLLLKKHIFDKNYKQVVKIIESHPLLNISNQTLYFILQVRQKSDELFKICIFIHQVYGTRNIKTSEVLKHLKNRQILKTDDEDGKKKQKFQNRISLNYNKTQGAFNDLTLYIKYVYGQDVTYACMFQKQQNLTNMRKHGYHELCFWQSFVSYVSNIYTKQQQIYYQVSKILMQMKLHNEVKKNSQKYVNHKDIWVNMINKIKQVYSFDIVEIYLQQKAKNRHIFVNQMRRQGLMEKQPFKTLENSIQLLTQLSLNFDIFLNQNIKGIAFPQQQNYESLSMQMISKQIQFLTAQDQQTKRNVAKSIFSILSQSQALQKSKLGYKYFKFINSNSIYSSNPYSQLIQKYYNYMLQPNFLFRYVIDLTAYKFHQDKSQPKFINYQFSSKNDAQQLLIFLEKYSQYLSQKQFFDEIQPKLVYFCGFTNISNCFQISNFIVKTIYLAFKIFFHNRDLNLESASAQLIISPQFFQFSKIKIKSCIYFFYKWGYNKQKILKLQHQMKQDIISSNQIKNNLNQIKRSMKLQLKQIIQSLAPDRFLAILQYKILMIKKIQKYIPQALYEDLLELIQKYQQLLFSDTVKNMSFHLILEILNIIIYFHLVIKKNVELVLCIILKKNTIQKILGIQFLQIMKEISKAYDMPIATQLLINKLNFQQLSNKLIFERNQKRIVFFQAFQKIVSSSNFQQINFKGMLAFLYFYLSQDPTIYLCNQILIFNNQPVNMQIFKILKIMNSFINKIDVQNAIWSKITNRIIQYVTFSRINSSNYFDYGKIKSAIKWLRRSSVVGIQPINYQEITKQHAELYIYKQLQDRISIKIKQINNRNKNKNRKQLSYVKKITENIDNNFVLYYYILNMKDRQKQENQQKFKCNHLKPSYIFNI